MSQTALHCTVDILRRRHARVNKVAGLSCQSAEYAVYNKAIDFLLYKYRILFDRLGEFIYGVHRLLRSMGPLNDFNDLHDQCRIEEMQVQHIFRMFDRIAEAGAYDI